MIIILLSLNLFINIIKNEEIKPKIVLQKDLLFKSLEIIKKYITSGEIN